MKEKIINAQKKWADGIIRMGELSSDRISLEEYARNFLEEIYDFENNQLLFKPTKASKTQFRNTREMALSYFIAGENKECDELCPGLDRSIDLDPPDPVSYVV